MTAEKANLKVNITQGKNMSDYQSKLRKTVNLAPIYFDQVENYIHNRIEDEELRERVLKAAKRYPHSALAKFVSNFNNIMTECQRQLNVEKNIDTQKRIVPPKDEITSESLIDIQATLDDEWMSKTEESLQTLAQEDTIKENHPSEDL